VGLSVAVAATCCTRHFSGCRVQHQDPSQATNSLPSGHHTHQKNLVLPADLLPAGLGIVLCTCCWLCLLVMLAIFVCWELVKMVRALLAPFSLTLPSGATATRTMTRLVTEVRKTATPNTEAPKMTQDWSRCWQMSCMRSWAWAQSINSTQPSPAAAMTMVRLAREMWKTATPTLRHSR